MKALAKLEAMLPEKKRRSIFPCSVNYFLPAAPASQDDLAKGWYYAASMAIYSFLFGVFVSKTQAKKAQLSYRRLAAGVPYGPFAKSRDR